MGLDTVELVMKVEETFRIEIPDAEAERIQTIGDLYLYILGRLEAPIGAESRCLSASTFYRLRRQLMGGLRVDRRRIRPAAALEDLIPASNRRSEWERLGKALGWELPRLRHPDWVEWVAIVLIVAWASALWVALGRLSGRDGAAVVAFAVLFVTGAIPIGKAFYMLTRPFAIVFPAADVRGLVPLLLAGNLSKIIGPNPGGWSRPDVWEMIIAIVAEQAGVSPDQLDESTSFVNDLGLD